MVQKIHDGREDVKIKELNKEQCVHCALYLSLYLDLIHIYIYITVPCSFKKLPLRADGFCLASRKSNP